MTEPIKAANIASEKPSTDAQGKWFKVETPNGPYFTPFKAFKNGYKYDFFTAGAGDKNPTPSEIVDMLKEKKADTNIDKIHSWYGDVFYTTKLISKNKIDDSFLAEVPAGVYSHMQGDGQTVPERLVPFNLREDTNMVTTSIIGRVKKDIEKFICSENVYNDLGIIYKLGFLLYGPPGNGKTTIIRNILSHTDVLKNSVIVFCNTIIPSLQFLMEVKKTMSDRMKVFIFEELTTTVKATLPEQLLNFLDGELSTPNTILFATTNYPEKLPGNIVDRPSRFDKLYQFNFPDAKERADLLKFFLKKEAIPVDLVQATENLSVAAIKEACLTSILHEIPLQEIAKELRNRHNICKTHFKEAKSVGFN